MKTLPLAKTKDILTEFVNDGLLVYRLKDHRALCLNKTSAMVWQECDGAKSVEAISARIGEEYPAEIVRLALKELEKEGLIERGGFSEFVPDISRREAARRIGAGAMVAIPVITSLVAPHAANAQSAAAVRMERIDLTPLVFPQMSIGETRTLTIEYISSLNTTFPSTSLPTMSSNAPLVAHVGNPATMVSPGIFTATVTAIAVGFATITAANGVFATIKDIEVIP